jgi:hypothetical protein
MLQGLYVLPNTYLKRWCNSFISIGPIFWDKRDDQEQRRSLDKGSKSAVQNHQDQKKAEKLSLQGN